MKILILDEIRRNWQNSEFAAKFLTKFALFDERKMAFWWQNLAEI